MKVVWLKAKELLCRTALKLKKIGLVARGGGKCLIQKWLRDKKILKKCKTVFKLKIEFIF